MSYCLCPECAVETPYCPASADVKAAEKPSWRPMSEAPRDGTEVLLLFKNADRADAPDVIQGFFVKATGFWFATFAAPDYTDNDFRAWMPVPQVPEKFPWEAAT